MVSAKVLAILAEGRKLGQKRTGYDILCAFCGEPFYVKLSWIKAGRRFCSMHCASKGKVYKSVFVKGHTIRHIHKPHTEEAKRNISAGGLLRFQDPAEIQKISDAHKGKKLSRETIRKCLARRTMSSLEVKFDGLIKELGLPYRFVGNGDFFIEHKNPDFININGQKIAVEVYCRIHKNYLRGDVEQWQKERSDIFAQYGWKVIYFDETQINRETVLSRLGDK